MTKLARAFAIVLFSLMSFSAVASAGPGGRVGLTDDPDSIFAGLQWNFELGRTGEFVLRPGIDFGIVDGPIDFFFRGTAHFAYLIPVSRDFEIYPLAGPVAFFVDAGDSDLGLGLDVGFGLGFGSFAIEAWFGIEDSPDVTLSLSFTL